MRKAKKVPRLSPIERVIYRMRKAKKSAAEIAAALTAQYGRPFNTSKVGGYMAKLKYTLEHAGRS